ncbi:unnamed protein product [Urochloa decumbens]|uniref:Uncharacterized protein n=1 Tax=Urochloa decumbens TaxID=240449 RepID=A0ABC8WKK4_9POAL
MYGKSFAARRRAAAAMAALQRHRRKHFTANSAYQANIRRLAASFPKNASSSPSLFATGVAGTAPDVVYALALCRGDTNASSCARCVASQFQNAQQLCALNKGATMFDDPCILRYADWDRGGGVRRDLPQDLLAGAVHAGHDGGRLPDMPRPRHQQVHAYVLTYPFFSGRLLLQLQLPAAAPPGPGPPPVNMTPPVATSQRKPYSPNPDDIQVSGSLILDLSTLREATDNFSESNKLGEGGFGAVYKGVLSDGQEIAVKRLSLGSRQGVQELKTELVLVAKIQHKNLVRIKGVCLEEHEKLLVYEYMPKRSLDTIIFESQKSKELDWTKRLNIINGIARGLQYLHEDSQLKIVHRDLKPSNVLLDFDYNPKISDFGLAKLFDQDQSQAVTSHIAGTYGYMAPEYAMHGQYSVKSDIYSLGVLILEMVTGRKNSSFFDLEQSVDLLSLVWEHWTTGTIAELLDPFLLGRRAPQDQMSKLVNIGLLCVQDNPADRPAMSSVNVMLSSDTVSLQVPSKPTFCTPEMEDPSHLYSDAYNRATKLQSSDKSKAPMSPNEVTLTELEPR